VPGLAAHRGRFLAAKDEVGLGGLLGLRDLVHQVLHVARQNHVPDTNRYDTQSQLARAATHCLLDFLSYHILVAQKNIEFAYTDNRTQRQLRLAVQRLTDIVRRADRLPRIGDAVRNQRVHTQADLVGSHYFLTADIDRGLAHVEFNNSRIRRALPERVQTRPQRVDVPSVNEQHTHSVTIDRADVE